MTVCRAVCLPADTEYLALVGGALSMLGNAANYEKYGGETPDDTAEFFQTILDQFYSSTMYITLGMIVPFGTADLPDFLLPCDGTEYDRVDYPALYSVLDSNLIVDADTFQTPDLGETYLVGAGGAIDPFDAIGANTVELEAAQNGPHTHSYLPPVANIDMETPGVPDILAAGVGISTQTGNSGSGDAHENRPASIGIKYGMVAYG
ncbi:MAG: tail fiber protein [Planctomycetes bacterium]|nr:tail fiber protein [Planctomycetota bacterium]